jgi:hypothetical protein
VIHKLENREQVLQTVTSCVRACTFACIRVQSSASNSGALAESAAVGTEGLLAWEKRGLKWPAESQGAIMSDVMFDV